MILVSRLFFVDERSAGASPGTVLLEAKVSAGSRMQLFDVSKKPSEYLYCLILNAILFIFVVIFPVNN